MTAAPPYRWEASFDEPARLWTLDLPDDAPVDVAIHAYDRLGLDCTDLLILARTRWARYEVSIAPPELTGQRRVNDLVLTFRAAW